MDDACGLISQLPTARARIAVASVAPKMLFLDDVLHPNACDRLQMLQDWATLDLLLDKFRASSSSKALMDVLAEMKSLFESANPLMNVPLDKIMLPAKSKRTELGAEVWTKQVATEFGNVLTQMRRRSAEGDQKFADRG